SGSTYHDLNASLGLNEQVTLALHAGRQNIAGNAQAINPDFTDYSVGMSIALPDSYTIGIKFTTVDFKDSRANSRTVSGAWFNTQSSFSAPNNNKDLAKDAIVLSLSKTF
ncbi:MAG: TorF family putative porin, partial [Burkholderiaceae bacterium]